MFDLRRRDLIILLGGAAAWPLAARAQQRERIRRIGVLMSPAGTDLYSKRLVAAFEQGLRQRGWDEDRNIHIDYRFGAADSERARLLAAELVRIAPDVIVASGTASVAALRQETRTLPIVFTIVPDPVASGFVDSLPRPGGNLTGFAANDLTIASKWLELLKQLVPRVTRVALIFNPNSEAAAHAGYFRSLESAAQSFALELNKAPVHGVAEVEPTISARARDPDYGLVVLPDPFTGANHKLITSLAARYRIAAIYPYRFFAISGGLISYGVDTVELYRQVTVYVDRILRGEKPADLPVQLPTKFELIINVRTAKALGLTIPETFLVRADEVIE